MTHDLSLYNTFRQSPNAVNHVVGLVQHPVKTSINSYEN